MLTYRGVVKPYGTISAVCIFLAGFLQGPFDHIHPDEYLQHEVSAPVHLHFDGLVANIGPLLSPRTADEAEVDLPWSATTPPSVAVPFQAVLEAWICPAGPASGETFVLLPQPRAHDPPPLRPLIARGPPA